MQMNFGKTFDRYVEDLTEQLKKKKEMRQTMQVDG
jgi:hypothetical protein